MVSMKESSKTPLLPVSDSGSGSSKKSPTMTKKGAFAAISYMACAVLLVIFNKAAISSYNFPSANVITLFQVISMESIRGINVPMYTALRRTTVAFTMMMEYILLGQKHSPYFVGSVGTIILGAFIAGARDLSFDFYGYSIVILSNITNAINLACIAQTGKSSGLNSFGLMWCTGITCGPILLIWAFFSGELETTMNFPYLYSYGFQAVMFLSCVVAFLLNYTVFLNTTVNSALTQSICGNLKDLFTIGFGWILFGGLPFDLLNVVGQSLGFLGSGLCAYCKLKGK
ncbi:UDP-sugar transporter DDB_G0278631 [Olea europaea subsp. europaea]|uniref:UDP-sugar transporter DDB_G0278631 n=1 Tax=Olea europaea subsp. europaea TaxID=158383 RepID=A0A8S0TKU4_OLEEU|nr:UDP-sugar transporter DDB_G0278631 [Olea europaea subsp. europaea]